MLVSGGCSTISQKEHLNGITCSGSESFSSNWKSLKQKTLILAPCLVDPHINLVVSVAEFEIMTGKWLEITIASTRVCSQSGCMTVSGRNSFGLGLQFCKLQVIQTDHLLP